MITFFNLKVDVNGHNPFNTISGFTLVQRYDRHHSFELRAPLQTVEDQGSHSLNKSKNLVGQPVTFEISGGQADGSAGTALNRFNGVITSVAVMRSGGSTSDLVVRGFSPTIILEHGKNTKGFSDTSLSGIFSSITSRFPSNGINFKSNPSPDPQLPFTLQYKESNYNFLARLANRWGQWFYFDGKDCIFGKPSAGSAIELKFGSDLTVFELGMAMAPTKFKSYSFSTEKDEVVEVGPQSISGLDQLGKAAFDSSNNYFFDEQVFNTDQRATDSNTLNDIAAARRGAIAGGMVTLSGTSTNAKLKIGASISVKADQVEGTTGGTTDYGTYIVTALSHTMDGRGHYQNYFESIPSAVHIPPPIGHVDEPICETQTAIVAQLGDKNGKGSVYIRFPWQPESEKIGPCRVAYPHAGDKRGFLFMPELKDEVLVTFGNNNPDRPVIIGSTYNGKNNQSDKDQDDNNQKMIRTRSGNSIIFSDKQGEESIYIVSSDGSNTLKIETKDKGKITITAADTLELTAPNIKINGTTGIKMVGGKVEVEGTEVKVTGSTSVDITSKASGKFVASTGLTLDSDADVKIDGLNVNVTAKVGATVKGNATAALEASGQTVVKGAIVMIN